MPTPTVPWRAAPPPPTWQPAPLAAPSRPATWVPARSAPGPVAYRAQGRTGRAVGARRPAGAGRRRNKGWIPGLLVVAFIVAVNVVPHLGSLFHRGPPAGVNQAVNGYYRNAEAGDKRAALAMVCSAQKSTWAKAQPSANGDTSRGITAYKISATRSSSGGDYLVDVDVDLATKAPVVATITVVHEAGHYLLCGGMNGR